MRRGVRMTITAIHADQDATVTRKAAGIWRLVMAIRDRWHVRRQLREDFKQYRLLQQVRLGTVPEPEPEPEEETYWETFDPEEWIGSTTS
jgi:hypothetical protein